MTASIECAGPVTSTEKCSRPRQYGACLRRARLIQQSNKGPVTGLLALLTPSVGSLGFTACGSGRGFLGRATGLPVSAGCKCAPWLAAASRDMVLVVQSTQQAESLARVPQEKAQGTKIRRMLFTITASQSDNLPLSCSASNRKNIDTMPFESSTLVAFDPDAPVRVATDKVNAQLRRKRIFASGTPGTGGRLGQPLAAPVKPRRL